MRSLKKDVVETVFLLRRHIKNEATLRFIINLSVASIGMCSLSMWMFGFLPHSKHMHAPGELLSGNKLAAVVNIFGFCKFLKKIFVCVSPVSRGTSLHFAPVHAGTIIERGREERVRESETEGI